MNPSVRQFRRSLGSTLLAACSMAGSASLTVLLSLAIGSTVGAGSLVEARWGREAAEWTVFSSEWFPALLTAAGIHTLCAALTRWPKKDLLVVQVGVLALLAGVILTCRSGHTGQVRLREGQATGEVELPCESVLQVVRRSSDGNLATEFTFFPGPFDWEDGRELDFGTCQGLGVSVVKYLRHAKERTAWVQDDRDFDGPALELALSESGGKAAGEEWLTAGAFGGEAVVGSAAFALYPIPVPTMVEDFLDPPADLGAAGVLSVHFEGRMQHVLVDASIGKTIPLDQSGTELELVEYLPNAHPTPDGRFESRGPKAENPVLELRVRLAGEAEPIRQVAFANRPLLNLDAVYGRTCPVRFWFHHPQIERPTGALFMQDGQGRLYCRTSDDGRLSEAERVEEGTAIRLAGGSTVTIKRYLPRARQEVRFEPVKPAGDTAGGVESAVQVEIREEESNRLVWLKRSDLQYGSRILETDQGLIGLSFSQGLRTMGATVRLEEVVRPPAQREKSGKRPSIRVAVLDRQTGDTEEAEISATRPLTVGNYRLHQSVLHDKAHDRASIVLLATHDPGRFLKYLGSAMICGGVLLACFLRIGASPIAARFHSRTRGESRRDPTTPGLAGAGPLHRRAA
jgi:hypothetical protein